MFYVSLGIFVLWTVMHIVHSIAFGIKMSQLEYWKFDYQKIGKKSKDSSTFSWMSWKNHEKCLKIHTLCFLLLFCSVLPHEKIMILPENGKFSYKKEDKTWLSFTSIFYPPEFLSTSSNTEKTNMKMYLLILSF